METNRRPNSAPRNRREFLADAIMSVGAMLGLGGLAFRFLEYLYPVVPPVKFIEVFASKESAIPPDGVRFVNLREGPVMLEKTGDEVRALSAICTHLGCIVHWHPGRREFICPCHGGVYAKNGQVISGPPPRPLPKIAVQVRSDRVFVRMRAQKEENV
jgi:cytochrome b6-f complex iron-sulfur subunit